MVNKIDSNTSACFIAEEVIGTPKTLPGVNGADAIWYEQEPNSYADFGGQIKSIARDPINASRQRKRGTITDLDAAGGYSTDITQNNMSSGVRLLQGFMFADFHDSPATTSATVTASGSHYATGTVLGSDLASNGAFASDTAWTKGTGWTISAGTAASDGSQSGNSDLKQTELVVAGEYYQVVYTATRSAGNFAAVLGGTTGTSHAVAGTYTEIIRAGTDSTLCGIRADLDFIGTIDNWSVKHIDADNVILAGDLIFASGFANPNNNGLKRAVTANAVDITVAETLFDASAQTGTLKRVGCQFGSGDATLTVAGNVATLGATAKDLTKLGLNVGQWIWIGGDDEDTQIFETGGSGYARILSITSTAIVFDKVTATFTTDNGAGNTIRIFFGDFIRNEDDPDLIVTRTYQLERQLGHDDDGTQAEYIEGAVADGLTINYKTADKLQADLTFLAMDNTFVTGAEGVKVGGRVAALGEDPFNTSSNVYRIRMSIIDPLTLLPSPLFAYVTDGTLTIKNNAALAKAVSVLGGFDVTVGTFEVGGSLTAYFTNVAAVQAVRDNSDVTLDMIFAKHNAGMVYDIPMMGLGNGRVTVEKDKAITIPLENLAAEGDTGYTLGITVFPYLPDVAMPT